jgi:hypothetical protein
MASSIVAENQSSATSVYKYYDRYNVLIYVGITNQGSGRNRQHNHDKDWWDLVAQQEIEHFLDRDDARRREEALIRQFRPPFNRQHNKDHAIVRAAYHALSEAADIPVKIRQRGRCIQLVASGQHVLATKAEDAAIAASLRHVSGIRVTFNGIKIGHVHCIEAGPIAFISISQRHTQGRHISAAHASVRQMQAKGGIGWFELRSLTLVGRRTEPN